MTFARGLLKAIALLGGAFITVVSLMAVAGTFTDNAWIRLGSAIVVMVGPPLLLIVQILSRMELDKTQGVGTDVLAVIYLAFAVVFVGVAHDTSRPLLQEEGRRIERAELPWVARAVYLLAGGRPAAPAAAGAQPDPASEQPPEGEAKPKGSGKPAQPRPGARKERTAAQIFAESVPAVVTISIKRGGGDAGGTGFLIDDAGTIGTSHRVIAQASRIQVKLADGTIAEDAEILADDEALDLAVLRIKPPKQPAVALGDSDKVAVGERAAAIGNPLGLEPTLIEGVISARRAPPGKRMIQISAPVARGNAGGPLLNSRGEVIGVSTGVYQGRSMLAIPINDLRAMLGADDPKRSRAGAR